MNIDISKLVTAGDKAATAVVDSIRAAEIAIQNRLDTQAKALGYDSILTAASYASLPQGAQFQAEGDALNVWRSQCWALAYQILNEAQAGTRVAPTIAQLLAEMPLPVLP